MEARGEIHGGRFVSGVSGEQYGLPDAVESLRQIRKESTEPALTYVSGVDPLNLIGIITQGPRIPSLASNILAFYGGSWVGSTKSGEVWVSEKLNQENANRVKHVLTSGRFLTSSSQHKGGKRFD
jgi:ATP-dependent Lhr-like helicase